VSETVEKFERCEKAQEGLLKDKKIAQNDVENSKKTCKKQR